MRATLLVVLTLAVGCGGIVDDRSSQTAGPAEGVPKEDDAGPAPKSPDPAPADAGPAPTDTAPGCKSGGEGGGYTGSACEPESALRARALDACKRTGLASFTPRSPCGDAYRYRRYSCCLGSTCGPMIRDGSETSCKSPETWKKYSVDDCAREGRTLGAIEYEEPCSGVGGFRGYDWECCAG